jgi:hypothetical protein
MFILKKIGEQEGGTISAQKWGVVGVGEVIQTMHTHVNKCKDDKIQKKEMLRLEVKDIADFIEDKLQIPDHSQKTENL